MVERDNLKNNWLWNERTDVLLVDEVLLVLVGYKTSWHGMASKCHSTGAELSKCYKYAVDFISLRGLYEVVLIFNLFYTQRYYAE